MHRDILVFCGLMVLAGAAVAEPCPAAEARAEPPKQELSPAGHGPSSSEFPSHQFQLAPRSARRAQIGVNFGLSQLVLGGFNFAGELRYERLWLEYSTGVALDLNKTANLALTKDERDAGLRINVPYTTGFGAGLTLLDELWIGVEFKTHRFEVTPPTGPRVTYNTYSIGPVLGYKFFVWRGLHINLYARYWPNVASSLDDDKVAVAGPNGPVAHDAHGFDFFANGAIGYAVDL
jgi:hypothetical protein